MLELLDEGARIEFWRPYLPAVDRDGHCVRFIMFNFHAVRVCVDESGGLEHMLLFILCCTRMHMVCTRFYECKDLVGSKSYSDLS